MRHEGVTLPRLREVRTVSGTVTAALRERGASTPWACP